MRQAGGQGYAAGMLGALLLAAALVLAPGGAGAAEGADGQGVQGTAVPELSGGEILVPLDPVHAPLTGPDRVGQTQLVVAMQLAVPEGTDTSRLKALMPRFRDALIRDLYAYPLSQTGQFPQGMLQSISQRVLTIAEKVYGPGQVTGVLFGQVMKMGC